MQFFPPISCPRLIYNILIPFNPREESSSKVSLFLTLYCPLGLTEPYLLLPLLDNPLQSSLLAVQEIGSLVAKSLSAGVTVSRPSRY